MVVSGKFVVMVNTTLSVVMVTTVMSVAFGIAGVIARQSRCHSNACMVTIVLETVVWIQTMGVETERKRGLPRNVIRIITYY